MDSPLNHLIGILQERVHMEPSQLVDKEARVEKVWIFNFLAMEALDLRAKVFILISWFILKFLYL